MCRVAVVPEESGIAQSANAAAKKYYKKTDLRDLDIEHEMLRQNILISYECKYIDERRFAFVSKNIDEIGRLIGDWFTKL